MASLELQGNNLIITPETAYESVYLRRDRPGDLLDQLSNGCQILINGSEPYNKLQFYLGDLQYITGRPIVQPLRVWALPDGSEFAEVELRGGQHVRFTGIYDQTLGWGFDTHQGWKSSYRFPFDKMGIQVSQRWKYPQGGNCIRIGYDSFSNQPADFYESDHISVGEGGFAGLNGKNENGQGFTTHFHLHDIVAVEAGGEVIYAGYTINLIDRDKIALIAENILSFRSGYEQTQTSGAGKGSILRHLVNYAPSARRRHPFTANQSVNYQQGYREAHSTYESIFMGGRTLQFIEKHVINELDDIIDSEGRNRVLNRDNLYWGSINGSIYSNQETTFADPANSLKVQFDNCFFAHLGETETENWWGNGAIVRSDADTWFIARNNKIGDYAQNIDKVLPTGDAKYQESGTTKISIPDPEFEDNPLFELTGHAHIEYWATVGEQAANTGDTDIPEATWGVSKANVDVTNVGSTTFITRGNRYAIPLQVGDEVLMMANTGFTPNLEFYIPPAFFIATIATIQFYDPVTEFIIENPYQRVDITFNAPSVVNNTGTYTDWDYGKLPEFLVDWSQDQFCSHLGIVFKAIQPNYFINPIQDLGFALTDGNGYNKTVYEIEPEALGLSEPSSPAPIGMESFIAGRTIGINFEMYWFYDDNGNPTLRQPHDLRIKKGTFFNNDKRNFGLRLEESNPRTSIKNILI